LCNGICLALKIPQNYHAGSMFTQGFVRCMNCAIYLDKKDCVTKSSDRLFCPCCLARVRFYPRCKTKAKFRLEIYVK